MTQEAWLSAHPYLLSVAEFHAQVERAAAGLPSARACVPNWQDYEGEYVRGVPLLRSCSASIDLRPVEITLEAVIGKLRSAPLRDKLVQDIRDLQVELGQDPDFSQRAVAGLLDPDASARTHFGLLRYLGWTVMARYLSRVVDAFGKWREEERWLRRYCPTCGSLPALASPILPHVWLAARHGSIARHRSWSGTVPLLWLLRHALAIPENGVPILRKRRRSSTRQYGGRGRRGPAYRLLPVLRWIH